MNFSEVALFVGLEAVVGFAGGLFGIGGALIAIPLLTAGFGFSGDEDFLLNKMIEISGVGASDNLVGTELRARLPGMPDNWPELLPLFLPAQCTSSQHDKTRLCRRRPEGRTIRGADSLPQHAVSCAKIPGCVVGITSTMSD